MELTYPPYTAQLLPKPTSDNPYVMPAPGEEILPVVEANGLVTARMTRSYAHGGSMLMHPVVHLHIINRSCELYLQKRAMSKDLLPGYWDTAVGGHVSYGEGLLEALLRESSEELGLCEYNPVYLDSYVFTSGTEKELVNVFACIGSFRLVPDPDEVDEGRWWTFREIDDATGRNILTPNFEGEFARIRRSLEALL